jgi:hypothetical protein
MDPAALLDRASELWRAGSRVAIDARGRVAEYTVTVNGLAVGDVVYASGSTGNATIMLGAYVSAANTLKVRVLNPTAGSLTPGNTGYSVLVVRPYPAASSTSDFLVNSPANSGAIPLSA